MGWLHEAGVSLEIPTDQDLAYLAGLSDGEGCFYAYHRSGQGIKISMVDSEAITWLYNVFSGTVHVSTRDNPKWRDAYTWQLQRMSDLRFLLPLLIPFLKVKHRQAACLLEYVVFSMDNKPTGGNKGIEWAEFKNAREHLRKKLLEARK